MTNYILIKKKLEHFDKKISVSGDKSISIRWILLSSLASGLSKAENLLISEDVLATIKAIRKLGIKIILNNKFCKIYGNGINGYKYKKNLVLNAENSVKFMVRELMDINIKKILLLMHKILAH